MIFTPENCELVLSGAKTMTRRVVKPEDGLVRVGEACSIVRVSRGYPGGRVVYEVGETYAIQPGRGKKSVGRIVITGIRLEKLQDISMDDCLREGVEPPIDPRRELWPHEKFKAIWDGLYANDPVKGWEANPDTWVISFELVEADNANEPIGFGDIG